MNLLQFSAPTNKQIKKGFSRVVGIFVVGFVGSLAITTNPTSTSALHAALLAGITAVYQLIESVFSTT